MQALFNKKGEVVICSLCQFYAATWIYDDINVCIECEMNLMTKRFGMIISKQIEAEEELKLENWRLYGEILRLRSKNKKKKVKKIDWNREATNFDFLGKVNKKHFKEIVKKFLKKPKKRGAKR